MARYGIVPRSEPINAVIFQATLSQLNLTVALPVTYKHERPDKLRSRD